MTWTAIQEGETDIQREGGREEGSVRLMYGWGYGGRSKDKEHSMASWQFDDKGRGYTKLRMTVMRIRNESSVEDSDLESLSRAALEEKQKTAEDWLQRNAESPSFERWHKRYLKICDLLMKQSVEETIL